MPGEGIWFIDDAGAPSLTLTNPSETFVTGPSIAAERPRGCAVQISDTKTAIIGGGSNTQEGETVSWIQNSKKKESTIKPSLKF